MINTNILFARVLQPRHFSWNPSVCFQATAVKIQMTSFIYKNYYSNFKKNLFGKDIIRYYLECHLSFDMSDFPVPCFAVVAEDFEGEEEGELSLVQGTRVIVAKCDDDGWFSVLTKIESGIFPGSYLDPADHITLPKSGELVNPVPGVGAKAGDVVKIQDITEEGFRIENNTQVGFCPWSAIKIMTGPPKRAQAPQKPVNNNPKPAGNQGPVPVGGKVVLQKTQSPNVVKPQANLAKSTPEPPARTTTPNQVKSPRPQASQPSNAENRPQKVEKKQAGPGEYHTSRFSTYKRPISIFNGDALPSDDLYNTIKPKNLYEIGMEGERKYIMFVLKVYNLMFDKARFELEGRFEFRATSDIPNPPRFQGAEKSYVTMQPSYVDWDCKKRSAVFDI